MIFGKPPDHLIKVATLIKDFWRLWEVTRLPRKTTWQPAWKPSKRIGFAVSPVDTARPEETRDSRRGMLEHQNERFVRYFLQSSHFVAS